MCFMTENIRLYYTEQEGSSLAAARRFLLGVSSLALIPFPLSPFLSHPHFPTCCVNPLDLISHPEEGGSKERVTENARSDYGMK